MSRDVISMLCHGGIGYVLTSSIVLQVPMCFLKIYFINNIASAIQEVFSPDIDAI